MVAMSAAGSSFIIKYNKNSLAAYALGGSVAEEVISSIRNATAFNTQDKLARQYNEHLMEAAKWGSKLKMVLALMIGGMMGVVSSLDSILKVQVWLVLTYFSCTSITVWPFGKDLNSWSLER